MPSWQSMRGGDAESEERRVWRPNWLVVGVSSWLVTAILVDELLDPPSDPVRVLVRSVLSGLMAWFLARVLTTSRRRED